MTKQFLIVILITQAIVVVSGSILIIQATQIAIQLIK